MLNFLFHARSYCPVYTIKNAFLLFVCRNHIIECRWILDGKQNGPKNNRSYLVQIFEYKKTLYQFQLIMDDDQSSIGLASATEEIDSSLAMLSQHLKSMSVAQPESDVGVPELPDLELLQNPSLDNRLFSTEMNAQLASNFGINTKIWSVQSALYQSFGSWSFCQQAISSTISSEKFFILFACYW